MCSHREPVYEQEPWTCGVDRTSSGCNCLPKQCERLKESEKAQDRCIAIPLYPQMTETEQDRVAELLKSECRVQG